MSGAEGEPQAPSDAGNPSDHPATCARDALAEALDAILAMSPTDLEAVLMLAEGQRHGAGAALAAAFETEARAYTALARQAYAAADRLAAAHPTTTPTTRVSSMSEPRTPDQEQKTNDRAVYPPPVASRPPDVAAGVRALNDALRRGFTGGQMVLTAGVAALPEPTRAAVLAAVRACEAFDVENDLYDEHDFGAVTVAGVRVFWKIDAYDRTRAAASPDPIDPAATARVLTVMLAAEY